MMERMEIETTNGSKKIRQKKKWELKNSSSKWNGLNCDKDAIFVSVWSSYRALSFFYTQIVDEGRAPE